MADADEEERAEGWTVVKKSAPSRRQRRANAALTATTATDLTNPTDPTDHLAASTADVTKALAAVSLVLDGLRTHPYATSVLDALSGLPSDIKLSSIRHYWVWGLGSLGNLGQAQLVRAQAAMAIVLMDRLALAGASLAGPPETVDPVFTSLDTAVYARLGFATQTGNHDWTVSEPTLLFAPHFEQVFATRLLRTTQKQGTLRNLVFIGNSISKCLVCTVVAFVAVVLLVHRVLSHAFSITPLGAQPHPSIPPKRNRRPVSRATPGLWVNDRGPAPRRAQRDLPRRLQRLGITLLGVSERVYIYEICIRIREYPRVKLSL